MLRAIVDSLENLPEAVRGFYVKREDGRFQLEVEPVGGVRLENVDNLKRALDEERSQRSAAEKALKAYKDIDPEAARDALSKMSEIDSWDPDKKLEEHKRIFEEQTRSVFEQQRQQLEESFGQRINGLEETKSKLRSQLENSMIRSAAISELSKITDSHELLLPHVISRMRLAENDDGTVRVEVLDPQTGNPRFSAKPGAAYNQPMGVDELVIEMKKDPQFQRAFPANGSGSGAAASSGGRAPIGPQEVDWNDPVALGKNLDALSKGDVAARRPGAEE